MNDDDFISSFFVKSNEQILSRRLCSKNGDPVYISFVGKSKTGCSFSSASSPSNKIETMANDSDVDDHVMKVLKEKFGHTSFRSDLQEKAVKTIARGINK
jgi:hypothetical protein